MLCFTPNAKDLIVCLFMNLVKTVVIDSQLRFSHFFQEKLAFVLLSIKNYAIIKAHGTLGVCWHAESDADALSLI